MLTDKELTSSAKSKKFTFFPHDTEAKIKDEPTAADALHLVQQADYLSIQALFSSHPELMFAETTLPNTTKKTTPLKYALYVLDSYTWKICQKICLTNQQTKPSLLSRFNSHTLEEDFVIKPIFAAYENYLTEFKHFTEGQGNEQALQTAWLNLGKMQRHLPCHILKEMCQPSGRWGEYDLVLLKTDSDDAFDVIWLKELSEQYNKSPIMINCNDKLYLYGFAEKKNWQLTPLSATHFKEIQFPSENNKPVLIEAKSLNSVGYELFKAQAHSDPWIKTSAFDSDIFPYSQSTQIVRLDIVRKLVGDSIPSDPTIEIDESEILQPLCLDDNEWGESFALARGAASRCLAISNPKGQCQMLGNKVQDDLSILRHLWQTRVLEVLDLLLEENNCLIL